MNLQNFIKNNTPLIARAYSRSKNRTYQRISELKIEKSGILDGLPFVKLQDGFTFFGHFPTEVQECFYQNFLDKHTKKTLCKEAVNVAYDIILRYYGAETVAAVVNSGQYHDFNTGNVLVEAGAFIGHYVMRCSQIIGNTGKILAIEAVAENFKILKKNIEFNKIFNVVIINKAVWNKVDILKFYRDEKQLGSLADDIISTDNYIEVPADTIDNMLKANQIAHVDFVRVQLNGSELEGLEGMTKTLKQFPKLMIAGMYKKDGVLVQDLLIEELPKMGYTPQKCGQSVFACVMS